MFQHKDRVEITKGAQMKIKLFAVFLGAAAFLLVSWPVLAHHGRANYDETDSAPLKGIGTECERFNPHFLIHLVVPHDTPPLPKSIPKTNNPHPLSHPDSYSN